jgi:hypothetical protein
VLRDEQDRYWLASGVTTPVTTLQNGLFANDDAH